MASETARRRLAPLLLVAAGLGAYAMVDRELPRDRDVALDFGDAAREVTGVDISWVREGSGASEAQLTTQWHFSPGTAPARLKARARLPDGPWDVLVDIERSGKAPAHWSGRVNLEGTSWWKRDTLKDGPVIFPVREALR